MDQRSSNQSNLNLEESQDDTKKKIKTEEACTLVGKVGDYIRKLQKEREALDSTDCSNAKRLIDKELAEIQKSKVLKDVPLYVDIYREKPIKVVVKVIVPVKDHPNFNFVGKLLGPKGNSLKRLQEETMARMLILGKGSIRDKEKEEELRKSLDPKYAHLSEDLHIEISVLAPPAEAHARMAFALAEIRKYLIPDYYDEIRKEQMQEIQAENQNGGPSKGVGRGRGRGSGSGMQPPPKAPLSQRQRQSSQANRSVLAARNPRTKESYDFYTGSSDNWQGRYDYGRSPLDFYNDNYDTGASNYNNFSKTNVRRIPRRWM